MECNKDEAVRAREIAERKFKEKDYAGARKFALKAQNLYPELEGLSVMIKIFDVYVCAHTKTSSGEVDWYGVLGLQPWTDEDTVRKQYHMLALMLHPDKNKTLGADGAFKLVSEAWSLLSDKSSRLAYNEKLNVPQEQVSAETKVKSTTPSANGFHNHKSTVSSVRSENSQTATASIPSSSRQNTQTGEASVPSSRQRSDTFWTICSRCRTQYEYLRVYLNHTLLCPNCNEAFFAMEKPPPADAVKRANSSFSQQKYQNASYHSGNNNSHNVGHDPQWNHLSGSAGFGGSSSSQVRLTHEQAQAMAAWERSVASNKMNDHQYKKRRTNESRMNLHGPDMAGSGLGSAFDPRRGYDETDRVYGFSGVNKSITRELPISDFRNILVNKARKALYRRLEEWRSGPINLKGKHSVSAGANRHKMHNNAAAINGGDQNIKSSPGYPSNDTIKDQSAAVVINVPDPDFHNFDLERTESSFGENQIWAAYDENDGMPRYYARIQKVISLKPFKMKISWLNSRSNSEFSSLDWVSSGFLKTCGDFRTGRHEISETLNTFSHKVKWSKGCYRGAIRILPQKGDVWALYRNWSPDWSQDTPNEVVHKYDMVEVLDDYTDEEGISVIPLTKVAGFKTVFQRHTDTSKARRIPKEEMFRFSHQVPDHMLTGEEADNAPEGCRELDPAATPLELLQVAAGASEEQVPMRETNEKVEEGPLDPMVVDNELDAKEEDT